MSVRVVGEGVCPCKIGESRGRKYAGFVVGSVTCYVLYNDQIDNRRLLYSSTRFVCFGWVLLAVILIINDL